MWLQEILNDTCGSHLWLALYFYGTVLHYSDPLYPSHPTKYSLTLVPTNMFFWNQFQYYLARGLPWLLTHSPALLADPDHYPSSWILNHSLTPKCPHHPHFCPAVLWAQAPENGICLTHFHIPGMQQCPVLKRGFNMFACLRDWMINKVKLASIINTYFSSRSMASTIISESLWSAMIKKLAEETGKVNVV